jgi:hypothetical protein
MNNGTRIVNGNSHADTYGTICKCWDFRNLTDYDDLEVPNADAEILLICLRPVDGL